MLQLVITNIARVTERNLKVLWMLMTYFKLFAQDEQEISRFLAHSGALSA